MTPPERNENKSRLMDNSYHLYIFWRKGRFSVQKRARARSYILWGLTLKCHEKDGKIVQRARKGGHHLSSPWGPFLSSTASALANQDGNSVSNPCVWNNNCREQKLTGGSMKRASSFGGIFCKGGLSIDHQGIPLNILIFYKCVCIYFSLVDGLFVAVLKDFSCCRVQAQ